MDTLCVSGLSFKQYRLGKGTLAEEYSKYSDKAQTAHEQTHREQRVQMEHFMIKTYLLELDGRLTSVQALSCLFGI